MGFIVLIVIIIIVIVLLFNANSHSSYQSSHVNYPRQREKQAIGKVTSLNSTTRTDQYGVSYITYTITYDFKAEDEKTYAGRKSVGSRRLAVGTSLTVYYYPTNPNHNRINY